MTQKIIQKSASNINQEIANQDFYIISAYAFTLIIIISLLLKTLIDSKNINK